MNAHAPELLVVLVHHRTPALATACLDSLEPEVREYGSAHVVLVDDGSGDGSALHLARAIRERGYVSWVTLLPLAESGGVASATNAALRQALGWSLPPRYVYLLDPDTVVLPGALRRSVEFMEERPEVGIVGSRCENADGSVRRSAFRFHSILGELEGRAALPPLSRALREYVVALEASSAAHRADWVSGAGMLVRAAVFEAVGLLDDGYSLHYEEIDLARRAARAGFACWYVPQSRVVRYGRRTAGLTREDGVRRRAERSTLASRRRYFVRHHGRAYANAADGAWLLGTALRRARAVIARRRPDDPPRRVRDFVAYNLPRWIEG